MRIVSSGNEDKTSKSTSLKQELAAAERNFVGIRAEILNASPAYRSLISQRQSVVSLDHVRSTLIHPGQVMLYYYFSRDAGYVLVIPEPGKPILAVPLRVSSRQQALLGDLINQSRDRSVAVVKGTEHRLLRGLGLKPAVSADRPDSASTPADKAAGPGTVKTDRRDDSRTRSKSVLDGPDVPLSRDLATNLVREYLLSIREQRIGKARGLSSRTVVSADQTSKRSANKHQPIGADPVTLAADILLPADVRSIVAQTGTKRVWIVPDGPLHQLPFEALVLGRRSPLDRQGSSQAKDAHTRNPATGDDGRTARTSTHLREAQLPAEAGRSEYRFVLDE